MRRIVAVLVVLAVGFACVPKKEQSSVAAAQANLLWVEAVVQSAAGVELTVTARLPEVPLPADPGMGKLAGLVVQKSVLFEGMATEVSGLPAIVKEVRGAGVALVLSREAAFAKDSAVRIKIPKKTLAVLDFEVLRGRDQTAGRVTLEGLTNALVDTGCFVIVERSKLKAVIEEIKLGLAGVTKGVGDKTLGQLLSADLVLTGTLAQAPDGHEVNLRLVSVRTGQAVAAVSARIPQIKAETLRDSGPMDAGFEEGTFDPSWTLGLRRNGVVTYELAFDRTTGAEGSKGSFRLDYSFPEGSPHTFARIDNRKKRDISLYAGAEFWVKATRPLAGYLNMITSHPTNPKMMDRFGGTFPIGTEWTKVRVPFDGLTPLRSWAARDAAKYGATPGDQVLRLERVDEFRLGIDSGTTKPGSGSVWFDNVRFYRE